MLGVESIKDQNILELLSKIQEELLKLFGNKLKNTILYGSYARLENTSDSDIDIMVLVDEENRDLRQYEDRITDIMVDLSLEYDVVVSIISESYEVYKGHSDILPFFNNVKKEGVTLYG
ncbi:nucleotidyltransferase domain-containing protein [Tissierella sp. MB52-C2]|uniref:nucleotidyltransferase family protein n=1 Tax=Tissierella sp. MB52-C2 TaxID=3070999 RepID=UPI00280A7019|nr:nucleotidyltransferase domain-containing protein [Tissierella sp. MB52-C2]WMM24207.1 nucleotidyltransferase domain-containing protein [Tissierella sp. MB52-C2]